jgi:hypothetical protein
MLEQDANYHLSASGLFPCANYILLEPRHISAIQNHLQGVYHTEGKLYTHTQKERFKIYDIYDSYILNRLLNTVTCVECDYRRFLD